MKTKTKLLSIITATALTLGLASLTAFAVQDEQTVRITVRNDNYTTDAGSPWDGVLIDEYVDLNENSDPLSLLRTVLEKHGYTQTGADTGYITEINGISAGDGAETGGWMATLDNWVTDEGLSAYTVSSGKLEGGDEISFEYSLNWGADIGYDYMGTDTSLSDLGISDGVLSPEFGSSNNYTLTLPEGTTSVTVAPKAKNRAFRVKTYKNEYTPAIAGTDYKTSEPIEVAEGDVIYIGVANSSWMSYVPEGVTETVYTVSIDKTADIVDTEVQSVISAIEAIDVNNMSSVTKARNGYNSLTDEQKSQVTNYDKLVAAENSIKTAIEIDKDIEKKAAEIFGNTNIAGNEWQIIIKARLGILSQEEKEAYINSVNSYVHAVGDAKLSSTRSTDNSRFVIALCAVGADPSDLDGYDLTAPLKDIDYVKAQGVNGSVYALIALDAAKDGLTVEKQALIDDILSAALPNGGWTFFGEEADPDMTAMAITALSKYYDKDTAVKKEIDSALIWLQNNQNDSGAYSSFGTENSDSTAQVIIALTSLGRNVYTDNDFIKNNNTLIDGLSSFVLLDNTFGHTADNTYNAYSTTQVYLALTALYRFNNGQTSLYDMYKDNSSESSTQDSSTDAGNTNTGDNNAEDVSENSSQGSSSTAADTDISVVNTGSNADTAVSFAVIMLLSAAAIIISKKKCR